MKLTFLLLTSFLIPAFAQADCKPLKVGDITIAFRKGDGVEVKSADGIATILDLVDATRPDCESIALAKGSTKEKPLVEVIYYPGESGTKVLIDDKDFVLIDVKGKNLAVDPVTLEEVQRRPLHEDRDVLATLEWKKKDGALVLEKTDAETKVTTQLWPLASIATPTPSPSPSATPADPSEKRTNPEGTSDI